MSDSTLSPSKTVFTPHDLELSLNYGDAPKFSLSWGSGSSRKVLDTDSIDLVSALLRAGSGMTEGAFVEHLAQELSLDRVEVASIVTFLEGYDFFQEEVAESYYEEWIRLGWADALSVHTATANNKWVHDYRGAPKVMVRDFNNQPVLPDNEKPAPFRYRSDDYIELPEPIELGATYAEFTSRRKTHRYFPGTTVSMQDIATIAKWTLAKEHHRDRKFVSPTYVDDGPFVGFFLFDNLQHEQAPKERFSAYAYDPDSHSLRFVNASDEIGDWSSLLWTQVFGNGAPVAFVLAVDWAQYMWKYRMARAYRWVFSEMGSFMHTAVVVANSLGLKVFQTPAIDDNKVCDFLKADPNVVHPIYWANFGRIETSRP